MSWVSHKLELDKVTVSTNNCNRGSIYALWLDEFHLVEAAVSRTSRDPMAHPHTIFTELCLSRLVVYKIHAWGLMSLDTLLGCHPDCPFFFKTNILNRMRFT